MFMTEFLRKEAPLSLALVRALPLTLSRRVPGNADAVREFRSIVFTSAKWCMLKHAITRVT